jgi:hypothetical protein
LATNNYYANIDFNGNAIHNISDASALQDPVTLKQLQTVETTMLKKVTATIGNGTSTSFSITHNLATQDIIVQLIQTVSPYNFISPSQIQATDINSVAISFATTPATNQYRVIILG